jgi:hypothetical protein
MHKVLKFRAQVIFRGKFTNGQALAWQDAELFRVLHLGTAHKGEYHLIRPKRMAIEADQSGDGGAEGVSRGARGCHKCGWRPGRS